VVRAVSLSHQAVGSKQPLRRLCGGRLASVFSFPRPHSCGSLWHWVCPTLLFGLPNMIPNDFYMISDSLLVIIRVFFAFVAVVIF
jgi:hypothetical protein